MLLNGKLIAEGDSITKPRDPEDGGATPWPTLFDNDNPSTTVVNQATSGDFCADALADGASQVDAQFSGTVPWCAAFLCIGSNDLMDSVLTPAQIHDAYEDWCVARKAANPTIITIVCTIVAREDVDIEPERTTFNNLLRADTIASADIIIDLDPVMGTPTSNPSLFHTDDVHPSTAGSQAIANAVKSAIQSHNTFTDSTGDNTVPTGGDVVYAYAWSAGGTPALPATWTDLGSNGNTRLISRATSGLTPGASIFAGPPDFVGAATFTGVSATPSNATRLTTGTSSTPTSADGGTAETGSDLFFCVFGAEPPFSGTPSGMSAGDERETFDAGELWCQSGVSGAVGTKSLTMAASGDWWVAIAVLPPAAAGGGGAAVDTHMSTLAFPALCRKPANDNGRIWVPPGRRSVAGSGQFRRSKSGLYLPRRLAA